MGSSALGEAVAASHADIPSKIGRYRWTICALLFFATTINYIDRQVFGFLALICAPIGLALGGILALILDRRSRRHTHEVAVDHSSVHVDPEPGTNGHGSAH